MTATDAVTPRADLKPLSGGRSGRQVPLLIGPPNSALRSVHPERVFVTDAEGRVVLDLTRERAKEVVPGRGFGAKRTPTAQEHGLMDNLGVPTAP